MIFNLILCLSIVCIYLLTHIGKRDKKIKDRLFLVIVFLLLFVLVASREMTIGNDTASYLNIFKSSSEHGWDILNVNNYIERGYLAFNALLGYLHITPRIFMCIMALIFCGCTYKFIKENSHNYLMSVLMFINLMFFYDSMSLMRQFMALSIILYFGFKFIKEKKLLKYILTIVFAMLFHSTALLAIFIYPIYHMKYSRKLVLITMVCSAIGLILLGEIYPFIASIFNRDGFYASMIGDAKLGNIISMAMFLLMYLFSTFVVKKNEKQKYSFYLYSLLFTSMLYLVSINMAVLSRAALYFAFLSIVSLPNIIESNMKESKIVVESTVIGLFMLYASIIMVNKPEWNSAYNYKTCLIPEKEYVCE